MMRISFICFLLSSQFLGCLSIAGRRGGGSRHSGSRSSSGGGSRHSDSRSSSSIGAVTRFKQFNPVQDERQVQVSSNEPTVGEYFLEAVDLLNRTQWRFFLPEDTDIDQDGHLSDLEIQHKFNSYSRELWELLGRTPSSITEEELRSFKLDIHKEFGNQASLTKVIDIAMENFPLKPILLAADANGDGFYDENDFYMPVKRENVNLNGTEVETEAVIGKDGVRIYGESVGMIGKNEGTVICKSLGFDNLEMINGTYDWDWGSSRSSYAFYKFICDGTEARLEDCRSEYAYERSKWNKMGVNCVGQDELGPLRLVGGKDSSAGDIFFGNKISCSTPYRSWRRDKENEAFYEVVCRELGFPGFVGITSGAAAFTKADYPMSKRIKIKFTCSGNEAKLADCQQTEPDYCSGNLGGVVCKTDTRPGIDEGLSELLQWRRHAEVWEVAGRFLFFADANGDGKLSVAEMSRKAKEIMTEILNFLDQTRDGAISVEDFTSLNLRVGPIHEIITELFNDVTSGDGELDLFNLNIAGQDLGGLLHDPLLKTFDRNYDGKLNAVDFFWRLDTRQKASFLIPMLSQKLDTNQDGKIQLQELTLFIDDMFKELDVDGNGAFTLEDVYKVLRNNVFDCFQVGALRSYITIILDTVDTQMKKFMTYLFKQLDLDGNGQITPEEFEKMKIPCSVDYRDHNPNASRMNCETMFTHFFGNPFGELRFPDMEMNSGRRGSYNDYGRRQPEVEQKPSIVDKLTNYACEILT